MKFFVFVSAILAVSSAASMFGFDNVRPIYEIKEWQDKHPALAKYVPKQSSGVTGRIVGGQEANPHQFPFQVAVLSPFEEGSVGLCGGSIISPSHVLTAAHCLAA